MTTSRRALLMLGPAIPLLAACGSASTSSSSPTAATTVSVNADYPEYESVEEGTAAADLIIAGTILTSRDDTLKPETVDSTDPAINPQAGTEDEPSDDAATDVPVTITDVRVRSVLAGTGAHADQTIEVSQTGGLLDGVTYQVDGAEDLSAHHGEELVLLLTSTGSGRPYVLINPQQGAYTADGSKLTPLGSTRGLPHLTSLSQLRA